MIWVRYSAVVKRLTYTYLDNMFLLRSVGFDPVDSVVFVLLEVDPVDVLVLKVVVQMQDVVSYKETYTFIYYILIQILKLLILYENLTK